MKYQGILVGQLSGSISGVTAAHNRGGPYFRRRATPTQPNTGNQAAVKALMSSLASAWQADLTGAQRAAWDAYGEGTPVTGALGEAILLTGQNWYVGNNVARLRAGLARVDDGPTTFGLPEMTLPVLGATDAPLVSVAYTNTDLWAGASGGGLIVQLSRVVAPTVNFYKTPFNFRSLVAGAGTPPTSPLSISSGLPAGYALGNVIFARIRAATADGRLSAPVILRAVIAAAG